MRRQRDLWILAGALTALGLTIKSPASPDGWWHLALGERLSAAHGAASEPFTILANAGPWTDPSLGYDVALAWLWRAGGAGLVANVSGVIATAGLALAVSRCRLPSSRPWSRALGMVVGAGIATPALGVGPEAVSVLMLAVVVAILWRAQSLRLTWLLVGVMTVWSAVDIGALIGLAPMIGEMAARGTRPRRRRTLLLVALGTVGVLELLYGAGLEPLMRAFGGPSDSALSPWTSPDFHTVSSRIMEVLVLLGILTLSQSDRPRSGEVALTLVAAVATLQSQRYVWALGVVAAINVSNRTPLLLMRLPASWMQRLRSPLGACCLALVSAAACWAWGWRSPITAATLSPTEPVKALTFVGGAYPHQRLYTREEWGGLAAVLLMTDPTTPPLVLAYDAPSAVSTSDRTAYLDIHLVRPAWADELRRLGLDHAVVPRDSQEVAALSTLNWTVDCRDEAADAVVMSAPDAGHRGSLPPNGQAPSC